MLISLALLAGSVKVGWAASQDNQKPDGRITELSLEQLGNLEVTTASKKPERLWKVPAAIHVITQDDTQRSGATSIPEVLRLAPGLAVARLDSDRWSVSIRGFGSVLNNKLLVLIDGRSVYTPLYAGVYWQVQATPLEDIDRIEVIRGPGGAICGANAVNAVINIITKSSKDTHGTLVTTGGGNVDQGTATFRYWPGTTGTSTSVFMAWASRGATSFIRIAGISMIGEWVRPGFAPIGIKALATPLRFKATLAKETTARPPPSQRIRPPARSQLMEPPRSRGRGNLVGPWKRVLND